MSCCPGRKEREEKDRIYRIDGIQDALPEKY